MRTFYDCIPCLFRQTLDAARMVTDDEEAHERLVRSVARMVADGDLRRSPPEMAQVIHREIRAISGDPDPYRGVKERFNALALGLLPRLRERVADGVNGLTPLETAVRLAIAGNIIDFGVVGGVEDERVLETIERVLTAPLEGDMAPFTAAVESARSILYLADNAGEIVFDQLLLEQLPAERVTVVVRGAPVINDATLEDAAATGLTERWRVIGNGSDAPGTVLADCSLEVRRLFADADMVIAKGQGNYETLSPPSRPVFFLLLTKCVVIARNLGLPVGSLVLRRS